MTTGLNATTTQARFTSLANMLVADLQPERIAWVHGVGRYDIYATDQGGGVELANGNWAQLAAGSGLDMAKQWTTTEDFIQNGKVGNATVNSIVKTEGFYSVGDGGSATWQHNGVTGQTTSQTPAQLGLALLNDSSGYQWALVGDQVDFRALGCNNTADLAAAQAGANSGLHMVIASHITIEGPLKLTVEGAKISSGGSHRTINGSSEDGAVIEVLNRKIGLKDFKLNSIGDRLAASYKVDAMGILVGGAGKTSIPTNTQIEGLDVLSNPGDGIYFADDAVGSTVKSNSIQMNRGHGIRLDDGASLGQSNLRAGTIGIKSNIIKNNGGYAVAERPEGGGSVYRIDIINNDIGDNGWNETEIGYAVDHHIISNCQNGALKLNAYNNGDYAGTTLSNGRNKYARAEPLSGVLFAGGGINDSVTATNERALEAKYCYEFQGDTTGIKIDRPNAKGNQIEAFVNFQQTDPTMNNMELILTSVNSFRPINGFLDNYYSALVDGVEYVYISSGIYSLGVKTEATISGGGIRLESNTVSVIGEGDAADSLEFLKPGSANKPLRDGDRFTFINENAYDITIQNSGADPSLGLSPIKTKSGASVVLTNGQTFTGLVIDGFLREL